MRGAVKHIDWAPKNSERRIDTEIHAHQHRHQNAAVTTTSLPMPINFVIDIEKRGKKKVEEKLKEKGERGMKRVGWERKWREEEDGRRRARGRRGKVVPLPRAAEIALTHTEENFLYFRERIRKVLLVQNFIS